MKEKKYFGIVEGFFSAPLKIWSWEERNRTLDFIQEEAPNINSYLYCPKDDELVTKKPYQLYSTKQVSNFKKFLLRCNENKITFIYGLNPSFVEKELNNIKPLQKKILMKLNQLIEIGVEDFCLLFDDIPIAYDVFEESATFSKETSNKIVELVNSVYKELESQINSFWFCSPDYNFNKATNLTRAIKSLDKDIKLFWTGNEIFSKDKNLKELQRAKRISGSTDIVLWDNYPVNDAEQNIGCFNLNGFYPIKNQVLKEIEGIFVNPMREAFANLPFYITFSKWIKQKETYNRNLSFANALKLLDINQDSSKIIELFRTFNNFDTEISKAKLNDFKLLLPNYNDVKNEYGKSFIKSISQVFKDYENTKELFRKIENKGLVKSNYFRKIDWFPTKTNVARYFTEIVRIVQTRLKFYSDTDSNIELEKYLQLSQYFEKTYKGKERLQISLEDNAKILKSIKELISQEQEEFVALLNSKKLTLEKKICLYFQRRGINRFNL